MQVFTKYPHLERLGTDEVEDILLGTCYLFPKIDGTNASVWMNQEGEICAGSRNREITPENDNQGFAAFVQKNAEVFRTFFEKNPRCILYGEWLVPHTLKTYKKDAWRKFYIFDVLEEETFLPYYEYVKMLDCFANTDVCVVPVLCIVVNPTEGDIFREASHNSFLLPDSTFVGEGIVVKNYTFRNKYGRVTWAKYVLQTFKEKHVEAMGVSELLTPTSTEEQIVTDFVTEHFVHKEYEKIRAENNGWNSKYIPQLLGVIWYTLIQEEMWNILKKYKNTTIDFKRLQRLVNQKVKEVLAGVVF